MRNLQSMLERMKDLAQASKAPRFFALFAALFMFASALHESGHDHSDHELEADCVICSIVSAQTMSLPSANSFAAPYLAPFDNAPTKLAAPFFPSTHCCFKPRGPPSSSPAR